MEINGMLLTGGASKRMKEDKACVMWNDKMLGHWSKNCLFSITKEILVSSNKDLHLQFGTKLVRDKIGSGPLAGLHACLSVSDTEWNIVLPCDTPNVTPEILQALVAKISDEFDVVVAVDGRTKIHPLIACYRKRIVPQLELQLLQGQYAVMALLDKVHTLYVDFDEVEAFKNMNTKNEME